MENASPLEVISDATTTKYSSSKHSKLRKKKGMNSRDPFSEVSISDDNNSYSTTDTSGEFEQAHQSKVKVSSRKSRKKTKIKVKAQREEKVVDGSSRKVKRHKRRGKKEVVHGFKSDFISQESIATPTLGFQLRTATIHNKVNEIERLLRKDPSLVNDAAALGEHGAVESGLTALHVACQLGHDECVGLLILRQANVNMQTEGGNTPLHFACAEGYSGCVDQLIKAGAKTHLKDILDQTPKDVAKLACKRQWDVCVDQIEAEEVRFGFQVLKLGAGFLAFSAAAVAAFWYLNRSVVDAEENPAVTNDD